MKLVLESGAAIALLATVHSNVKTAGRISTVVIYGGNAAPTLFASSIVA